MAKYNIYYWDDEEIFLKRFEDRHSKDYEINSFTDTTKLMERLRTTTELPDVILLDLYQAKGKEETSFEEKNALAEYALKKLSKDLDDVKEKVEAVREPIGIDLLKLIKLSKETVSIPVAIYTRRGLLILDDKCIRDVADNNGKWLLKNSKYGKEHISKDTEKIWIDSMIQETKQNCQEGMTTERKESEGLAVPKSVTLKWLFENVSWKLWVSVVTLLISIFIAGIEASRLDLVKELFELRMK